MAILPLDWRHCIPHMTKQQLDGILNSSLLKLLQYAVQAVILPLILWFANTALHRLDSIEQSVQNYRVLSATSELRMATLEAANKAQAEELVRIRERLIILEQRK